MMEETRDARVAEEKPLRAELRQDRQTSLLRNGIVAMCVEVNVGDCSQH